MILPGATLGMLGGGQLGRMFTQAAHSLGYRVIVFDPDPDSPAGQIADEHRQADYRDLQALDQLAKACDVVTTEFENIPAATLRRVAMGCTVCPNADAVEIAQHRIREKRFIHQVGLQTAPFAVIETADDIDAACQNVPFPAILKSAEFGYDGKGQIVVSSLQDLRHGFEAMQQAPCVLEQRVELACEVSVVLARSSAGEVQCFPVAENVHRNGILHRTNVPANINQTQAEAAQQTAIHIAHSLRFVGVLAVEFFITRDAQLLVNEIAPRTHNSGHFSIDACITSQFEQQVRAICSLPFGATEQHSAVAMVNLLGDLWEQAEPNWAKLLDQPKAKLHLYGKNQPRTGRKMGHFCLLGDRMDTLADEAEQLFRRL